MDVKARRAIEYIEEKRLHIIRISDDIWRFAEVGLHEHKSAECLAEALEKEGFCVAKGVAGMPTAFSATWGAGRPVIGFLGEYDALPGLSQKAVPVRDELEKVNRTWLWAQSSRSRCFWCRNRPKARSFSERGLPGTIKYFGCLLKKTSAERHSWPVKASSANAMPV